MAEGELRAVPIIESEHVPADSAMFIPRGVTWPLFPGETMTDWTRRVLADPRVCLLTGEKHDR